MVAALKADGYLVHCFDTAEHKSDFPADAFTHRLGEFDLVVGCSGTTSVKAEQHAFLKKGCVLASMSSSDREFDAIHLRRKTSPTKSCMDHIEVDDITMLNCGFPISFFTDEPDEPHFFQFIRGLIISCLAQAIRTPVNTAKGFIELNQNHQRVLVQEFKKIQSRAIASEAIKIF